MMPIFFGLYWEQKLAAERIFMPLTIKNFSAHAVIEFAV
jgi:hypothetical protein